jgi:hypothetical protein
LINGAQASAAPLAIALIAVPAASASAGVGVIDPLAAVLIAGIAANEGAELWRGEECACHTIPGRPSAEGGCSSEDNTGP